MNLKDIADYLTTALNGNNLQYDITDDIQLFDEEMKIGGSDYTPGVLSLVSPFVEENSFRETYVFNLHFKVRRSDRDLFYSDVASFILTETPTTIGTYHVVKTYQHPQYASEGTDNGTDYLEFDLSFTWVYNLSVVGRSSTISIDGVQIPFTSCRVEHDTSYISNQSSGNNYRLTNDIIDLTIPLILSNSKVSTLYADVNSDDYNKGYSLTINGITKSVTLKKGVYVLTNTSGVTDLLLKLETSYPRVSLTLDGETIPNSAYSFNGKKLMETDKKYGDNDRTVSYPTEKVKTWSITLVKDTSTVYAKVIADGYGDTIDTTYTLVRDGLTFTVFLGDFTESYTETGDMAVQCQFLEKGE